MKKDNGENGMDAVHVHFSRELKDDNGQAWWKAHGYKDRWGQWQVRMDDKDRDDHVGHDHKSATKKKTSEDHDREVENDPAY